MSLVQCRRHQRSLCRHRRQLSVHIYLHRRIFTALIRADTSIRVLLEKKTTRVTFLLLEYSLLTVSGWKFSYPVAVFLQSEIPEILSYTLPTTKNLWWVSVRGPEVLVTYYFRLQISISGCSFSQSIDELFELTETWGFAISFVDLPAWKLIWIYACRGDACSRPWPFGPQVRWPTTRSSSLAACIKVLPVLTSTRVKKNYSLVAGLVLMRDAQWPVASLEGGVGGRGSADPL